MKLVTLIHSKLIKFNQTKIGSFVLGGNILLLETIGKKSNKVRKVPLSYVDIKNGYLVAASYGGRDNSPGWYYNIKDNEGYVTVNKNRYKVKSEIVKDEDSEKFWNKLLSIYPTFNIYRARTERKIPLIKLIKV